MKKYFVILVAVMAVKTGTFAQSGDTYRTVISPTAMNILFMGLDNPLSIAISGVPLENTFASINNGSLTQTAEGGWIARPSSTDNAVVTVTALIDGQVREMGQMTFRVLRVPAPQARISGKTGGCITIADLINTQGIEAFLGNFLFDMRFMVTGFTMMVATSQGEIALSSNSFSLTQAQRELLRQQDSGSSVIFTNIRANNPTLGNVDLNPIVFRID